MAVKKEGMDIKRFNSTKFTDRTDTMKVPELAPFFPEGAEPVLILRGITGEQALTANEAADRSSKLIALAEKLSGGNQEAATAVAEALGVAGKQTPAEFSRRVELLLAGSVTPVFDRQSALKLAMNYPTVFLAATTKILNLTGMGRVPGKPQGSGETPASVSP
ncbi:MAG: hypothetical protein C0621_07450 [Desulfuromonas sp.]|nr:MAG: hypothetical protein C0621_07450 [Desulfuromonas sp.]